MVCVCACVGQECARKHEYYKYNRHSLNMAETCFGFYAITFQRLPHGIYANMMQYPFAHETHWLMGLLGNGCHFWIALHGAASLRSACLSFDFNVTGASPIENGSAEYSLSPVVAQCVCASERCVHGVGESGWRLVGGWVDG